MNSYTRLTDSPNLVHLSTPVHLVSWVGGKFNKNTTVPDNACVPRESCFSPCPSMPQSEVNQFSSSLYVPGEFQAAVPVLEPRANESVCE